MAFAQRVSRGVHSSRRRGLPAASLALLLILSACSIGGDDDDPTATAPPEPTDTAVAAASPTSAGAPTTTTVAPTTTEAEPTATEEASTATTAAISTQLGLCSALELVSALQTPVPVTPEPTPSPTEAVGPTPTPAPTNTLGPAPSEDRVGFPEGYQENFHLMYVFDRPDNVQVRVICGNDVAASAQPGEPMPYGSILVMETWRAKRDADGAPVLDENGRFIRESLGGIFIMRKEPGFGEAYQDQRSGEWEYVAFRPDGEYSSSPERTNACAACHQIVGEENDYVFRLGLFFDQEAASTPPELGEHEVNIFDYQFLPGTLEVPVGTTVTWINNDVIDHTVTSSDGLFDSGDMLPGDSFSFTFSEAGEYEYVCTLHRGMAPATIIVTP